MKFKKLTSAILAVLMIASVFTVLAVPASAAKTHKVKSFEVVKGQKTTIELPDLDAETGFNDVKLTGGALPGGLSWSWSDTKAPVISGTPTVLGEHFAEFTIKLNDGNEVEYDVYIMVTNNNVMTANETITFSKNTSYSKTSLKDSDHPDSYYSVSVYSGKLPAGISYSWGEVETPYLKGTPTEEGTYKVVFRIVYYNGDVKLYTVNVNVRDLSQPLDTFVIDMSGGPAQMTASDYLVYIVTGFTYAKETGQINWEQQPDLSIKFDLDKDGSYDVLTKSDGSYMMWSLIPGYSLKNDFKLTLSEETLAKMPENYTAYANNYVFKVPPKMLDEIRINLINGDYIVPEDEFEFVFLTLLFGASENLFSAELIPGSASALDLDKDGHSDVMYKSIDGKIVFRRCKTANTDGTVTVTLPKSVTDKYGTDMKYAKKITFDFSYKNPFKDVPAGMWYTNYVLWNQTFGYMNGTSPTTFVPNGKVTRAMFVTILANIDGADVSSYKSSRFSDVAVGQWYTPYIEWAADKGYASGYGGGRFGPNDYVTREQMAVFLYYYTQKKGWDVSKTTSLSQYADKNQISDWALTAVTWIVAEGIISGTSQKTLEPRAYSTRAQIAVVSRKYIQSFGSLEWK